MPVAMAYGLVVLIWSTTPLAIVWSNESLSFIAAVTLRMVLAFVLACIVLLVRGERLSLAEGNWKVYAVASLGLFPNMLLVYWSAQFITSGLLAIIFGLSPFFTGIFSLLLLKENVFNWRRLLALPLALIGLGLIFSDQLTLGSNSLYGVLGMLVSCVLFALTGIYLKKMNSELGAINQTTGALGFSLPGFLLCWYLLDGEMPGVLSLHSIVAVTYLALMGSLVGIALFIFLIRHLSMDTVSLITMLSPVMALCIGVLVADELVSPMLVVGAILVLFALLVYQGIGFTWVKRRLSGSEGASR